MNGYGIDFMAVLVVLIIGFVAGGFTAIFVGGIISNGNEECPERMVCKSPCLLVGTSCCLDENDNRVCDSDEAYLATTVVTSTTSSTTSSTTTTEISTTSTTQKEPTEEKVCKSTVSKSFIISAYGISGEFDVTTEMRGKSGTAVMSIPGGGLPVSIYFTVHIKKDSCDNPDTKTIRVRVPSRTSRVSYDSSVPEPGCYCVKVSSSDIDAPIRFSLDPDPFYFYISTT